ARQNVVPGGWPATIVGRSAAWSGVTATPWHPGTWAPPGVVPGDAPAEEPADAGAAPPQTTTAAASTLSTARHGHARMDVTGQAPLTHEPPLAGTGPPPGITEAD